MAFARSLLRIALQRSFAPPIKVQAAHRRFTLVYWKHLLTKSSLMCGQWRVEQCLETRLGPRAWSLAGVVDLDLQVDCLKHAAHPGFQLIQLGRFTLQRTLIHFIGALQF